MSSYPKRAAFLASVVSKEEAAEALKVQVDVIDVKNPAEGALGAALPETISEIRDVVPKAIPVSAAIGDMPYLPGTAALAAIGAAQAGASIIKVGLYGAKTPDEVLKLLFLVSTALKMYFPTSLLVAGAYADAQIFGGINFLDVPALAAKAGAAGCLLDTFDKSFGHNLLEIASMEAIGDFVSACREWGLFSALAGSLKLEDVPLLLSLRPDYLGFRGALCEGGRSGKLSSRKVLEISSLIAGESSTCCHS
ncbi:MAG: (5-formylfuran-3-yl)methyl phosphate synthase [Acetomicrobium sp.]